jgi:hypothetical protein
MSTVPPFPDVGTPPRPLQPDNARVNGRMGSFSDKVVSWIIVGCMAAAMLFDPRKDALGVASAAFVVAMTLASSAFSYSRTLKDGSSIGDEVVFAGERLLSGAILFLFASIFKYLANDLPRYIEALRSTFKPDEPAINLFEGQVPSLILSLPAFAMFLVGLVYAQLGVQILLRVARHRIKRRPGTNDFIEAAAYNQYLTELEKRDAERTTAGQRPSDTPGR